MCYQRRERQRDRQTERRTQTHRETETDRPRLSLRNTIRANRVVVIRIEVTITVSIASSALCREQYCRCYYCYRGNKQAMEITDLFMPSHLFPWRPIVVSPFAAAQTHGSMWTAKMNMYGNVIIWVHIRAVTIHKLTIRLVSRFLTHGSIHPTIFFKFKKHFI